MTYYGYGSKTNWYCTVEAGSVVTQYTIVDGEWVGAAWEKPVDQIQNPDGMFKEIDGPFDLPKKEVKSTTPKEKK